MFWQHYWQKSQNLKNKRYVLRMRNKTIRDHSPDVDITIRSHSPGVACWRAVPTLDFRRADEYSSSSDRRKLFPVGPTKCDGGVWRILRLHVAKLAIKFYIQC